MTHAATIMACLEEALEEARKKKAEWERFDDSHMSAWSVRHDHRLLENLLAECRRRTEYPVDPAALSFAVGGEHGPLVKAAALVTNQAFFKSVGLGHDGEFQAALVELFEALDEWRNL